MAEMTRGNAIHFVRPQESGCRAGKLLADSFEEMAQVPKRGLALFGYFAYGDPAGESSKHTWQTTRRHDPLGGADTWHLARDCPFAKRPAPSP